MCLTLGLARSTSNGHDRLDIVFGDLLRFAARATPLSAAAATVGPMVTLLPELLVTDPAALRAWLEEHHATSPGVRLVLTKKGGSDTTITCVQIAPGTEPKRAEVGSAIRDVEPTVMVHQSARA